MTPQNTNPIFMGICQMDTGANWKGSQKIKLEKFEQQNKLILDYNPGYKINIYESTLLWINDSVN